LILVYSYKNIYGVVVFTEWAVRLHSAASMGGKGDQVYSP